MTQFSITYEATSQASSFGEINVKVKYRSEGKFESITTGEVHEEVLDILTRFEDIITSNSVYKIRWQECIKKDKGEKEEKLPEVEPTTNEEERQNDCEIAEWVMGLQTFAFEDYEPVKFDLNTEDREKWALSLKNKAAAYFQEKNYAKSLEYFQKSLTMIEWDTQPSILPLKI